MNVSLRKPGAPSQADEEKRAAPFAQTARSPLAGEGWGGGCSPASTKGLPPSRIASRSDLPRKGGGDQDALPHPGSRAPVVVAGVEFSGDVAGALYWPQERLLAVSDLHLEKGSSFAVHGSLLPPYDTADTLGRLSRLIGTYAPRTVVALGDSFHDRRAPARLSGADRDTLACLQRGRDWIWIAGNHDPEPHADLDGQSLQELTVGSITFRHRAEPGHTAGEISGHWHPVVVVAKGGRGMRRRCFVADGQRCVMPAFGAYAGGLNVRHRAIAALVGRSFTAHVIGETRVYAIASSYCVPDWGC